MKKLLLVLGALATLSGQVMAAKVIIHRYVDENGHPAFWTEYIPGPDGEYVDLSKVKLPPEEKKELPISERLRKSYENDRIIQFTDYGAGGTTVTWDKEKRDWAR